MNLESNTKIMLQTIRKFIEFCGQHPFATGLLSILGFIGLWLSVYSFMLDRRDAATATQQVTEIKETLTAIANNKQKTKLDNELLQKLLPNNYERKSIAFADDILGPAYETSARYRAYIKDDYRIEIRGFESGSYSVLEIGPSKDSEGKIENPLTINGPDGRLVKLDFETLTLGSALPLDGICNISEWHYGGNGACMNTFEVECSSSRVSMFLNYRAGIHSCGYSWEHGISLPWPDNPSRPNTKILHKKELRDSKINFFAVSQRKRERSRLKGGN